MHLSQLYNTKHLFYLCSTGATFQCNDYRGDEAWQQSKPTFSSRYQKATLKNKQKKTYSLKLLVISQQENSSPVKMKSLPKCPLLRQSYNSARATLAPKLLHYQPVLKGAVTRAKEQASWAGSAPSTGRTAHTGASVATHWFIAI